MPHQIPKSAAKPRKLKDPNAPKRPVGRPRKEATVPQLNDIGPISASTSESDSEDLEIDEVAETVPDILKFGPPRDFERKAIYDAVRAVWSPRNKRATPEKIRDGLSAYADTVKRLRDAWKVKNEALKQAELANTTAIPTLKDEAIRHRRLMESVAKKTLEMGHGSIIERYVDSFPLVLVTRRPASGEHFLHRSLWRQPPLRSD